MNDKQCSKCYKMKPLSYFHNNKSSKDGKTSLCKDCACKKSTDHNNLKFEKVVEERKIKFLEIGGNWKDVVGWENYYSVCDDGRVLSKRRMSLLVPVIKATGYLCVSLAINKNKIQIALHRLVSEAFIPNPENKREVNHIDGNKANPHISNLEWVTRKENAEHMHKTGLITPARGETLSKLTEDQVREIKNHKKFRGSIQRYAERFDVSHSCIASIVNNKNWKHII